MSRSPAQREGLVAAAIGAALAGWIARDLRRDAHPVDPRLNPESVTTSLADAIPGVGPARREAVAAAIRAGRWQDLTPAVEQQVQKLIIIVNQEPRSNDP